jgi:hypothetical protein
VQWLALPDWQEHRDQAVSRLVWFSTNARGAA